MTRTEAYIALNMVAHLGPIRLRKLLDRFQDPQRILRASRAELQTVDGLPKPAIEAILSWESETDLTAELRRISEYGAKIFTQEHELYPRPLREIYDPPIVLYIWGEILERDQHAMGVVGSRRTTHYGIECAKRLSYQIAYSGITVVSGLARGIDTAAHQGALAAKGRTIAVLGTGLHYIYPAENRELAEKISTSGAVVTEFPMDTTPDRQTFPMRNRIISGLSFGLLVVEAGANSGALISASQAADQGRSLYAVPGPIDRPNSFGSNRLIQQGAKLVMSVDDILEDLQTLFPKPPELVTSQPPDLEGDLLTVYKAINSTETSIDTIIEASGLTAGAVSAALLQLEMRRLVRQLPGKFFVKLL